MHANIFGDPDTVKQKFTVIHRHCEAAQRNYDTIERTNVLGMLLARDASALAAKRTRLGAAETFRGFSGTPSEAADLIGQYREAGVQLFICSAFKNDMETLELLASR